MPGITNHGLAMVLLYELLLGPNQALRGGGALKRMLLEKEDTLRRILTNMIEDPAKTKRDSPSTIERTLVDGTIVNARPPNNTPSSASSSSSPFPRYVRINTCRITTAEVVHKLQQYTKSIPSKPTSSTMDASNNTNKTMGGTTKRSIDRNNEKSMMNHEGNNMTHGQKPRIHSSSPTFYLDRHIPDLLVFPHNATPFLKQFESEWVDAKNWWILQDKASCIPALCLVDPRDCHDAKKDDDHDNASTLETRSALDHHSTHVDYLDACAAPGNKTSHLISLLWNSNNNRKAPATTASPTETASIQVLAWDRDPERHEVLQRRLEQLIPSLVTPSKRKQGKRHHPHMVKVQTNVQDVLEINPDDYPDVRYVLLDPTCSGSGIYHNRKRGDGKSKSDQQKKEETRTIESLASFQVRALQHVLRFPNVQRVVYSTCSIHVQENEGVIGRVLHDQRHEWEVIAPHCFTHWTRRGWPFHHQHHQAADTGIEMTVTASKSNEITDQLAPWTEEEATKMIRVCEEDETNGFFVCCLQRRKHNVDYQSNVSSQSRRLDARMNRSPADAIQRQAQLMGLDIYDGHFLCSAKHGAEHNEKKLSENDHAHVASTEAISRKRKLVDIVAQSTGHDKDIGRKEIQNSSKGVTGRQKVKKVTTGMVGDRGHHNVLLPRQQKAMSKVELRNDAVSIPNKVLKKLAWKKRQRNMKLNRLEKSASLAKS